MAFLGPTVAVAASSGTIRIINNSIASFCGCPAHSLLSCCSVRAYGELTGRVSIVSKRQV